MIVGVAPVNPLVGDIVKLGVPTVVVAKAVPVTLSVIVSVPVVDPVVTTTVAAIALVTFWDIFVTPETPLGVKTVVPSQFVPLPASVRVMLPE